MLFDFICSVICISVGEQYQHCISVGDLLVSQTSSDASNTPTNELGRAITGLLHRINQTTQKERINYTAH